MAEQNARKRKTPASPLDSDGPDHEKLSSTSNPPTFSSSSSNPPSQMIPLGSLPQPSSRLEPSYQLEKRQRYSSAELSQPNPVSYPWVTDDPTTVRSLKDLQDRKLNKISGKLQCKYCKAIEDNHEFDLEEKYSEVAEVININKETMSTETPVRWLNPGWMNCNHCHKQNCLKPVIPRFGDEINWLFLFLGQMLGFCTVDQLRYFCTKVYNRSFASEKKPRLLVSAYLGLFKQLDPTATLPFDV